MYSIPGIQVSMLQWMYSGCIVSQDIILGWAKYPRHSYRYSTGQSILDTLPAENMGTCCVVSKEQSILDILKGNWVSTSTDKFDEGCPLRLRKVGG